jgi:Deoxycytidylate deaminase
MTQQQIDAAYLDMAERISDNSEDPSTKTGCVVVAKHGREFFGWNHLPPGTPAEVWNDREAKYARVVHAEIDALMDAGLSRHGATVYMHPWMPCERCAASLASAGVARVVARKADPEREQRWAKSFTLARQILADAGVELVEVE